MGLKNKKEIGTNLMELEIEVSADEFKDATDVAYKKMVKDIKIDGFRQGKAPKGIIEKAYGKEVFYEEAVNFVFPYAYDAALKEADVTPVSQPELEIVGEVTDAGFVFKAKVTVKPEITLKAYKGLKAAKPKVSVTAKEVTEDLEARREKVGRQVAVEGKVEKGDTAVINFEGFVDGTAFPGGKGEEYPLVIGSGSFIPGFEEQLIGCEKGEDKDVIVTFPEEYHEDSLRGKEATFKCKVLEVKRTELPALDDELAKDISEFDTLDELKNDIKAKIKERKTAEADHEYEDKLMGLLADNIVGEIPEIMYDNEIDYMVENFEERLKTQGIELDMYLTYTNTTQEQLRENFAEQAKQQVRIRLALEAVAKAEKLEASADELEEEYKTIADSYQMPVERIKAIIPSDGLENDIRVKKAIDIVKKAADSGKDAKEASPEKTTAAAPAKKTTKSSAKAEK